MLSQGGIGSTSEESSGNGERLINVKEEDSPHIIFDYE